MSTDNRWQDWSLYPVNDLQWTEHEIARGVHTFGPMAIARQCHAFVGHFQSEFSVCLYQALCVQHSAMTGICPPR